MYNEIGTKPDNLGLCGSWLEVLSIKVRIPFQKHLPFNKRYGILRKKAKEC